MKINIILVFLNSLFAAHLYPPDGSELNYIHVKFQWENILGANKYNLELSSSNNFNTLLMNLNTTESYYIEKDNLNWQSSYYWRVRPENGDWSVASFTIGMSSEIFQNDNYPIEILINDSELTLDGITIFGSYYNNYSAAIDMSGNEVWNSGGINTNVFFGLDNTNNYMGGKFLSQYNNSQ